MISPHIPCSRLCVLVIQPLVIDSRSVPYSLNMCCYFFFLQESKILKFLGFMWNPLSWVMEAAAIMAIALANGKVRGKVCIVPCSLSLSVLCSLFIYSYQTRKGRSWGCDHYFLLRNYSLPLRIGKILLESWSCW